MIPEGLVFMKLHQISSWEFVCAFFSPAHPWHDILPVSWPWWDSASTSHFPTQTSASIYVFMVFSLVFNLI